MSRQAGVRRPDNHVADGQHRIQRMIECIKAVDMSFSVDVPADLAGDWWIDLSFEGFSTNVVWRADRGFGIFTSDDDAYGSRPDEVYREPELAAKRLRQLAKRARSDRSAMKLGEVRKLFDFSQTGLAERIRKDQGFISRLERQNDALMSTIREYVEALGGEVRLMVRFDGLEAVVDFPKRESAQLETSRSRRSSTPGRRSAGTRKVESCS